MKANAYSLIGICIANAEEEQKPALEAGKKEWEVLIAPKFQESTL